MQGAETEWQETWRRSESHAVGFARRGSNFAYQEAPEVISRGSWRLYPLPHSYH